MTDNSLLQNKNKEESYFINDFPPITRTTEHIYLLEKILGEKIEKIGKDVIRSLKDFAIVNRFQRYVSDPSGLSRGTIISIDTPAISAFELEKEKAVVLAWGDYLTLSRHLAEAKIKSIEEEENKKEAFWQVMYNRLHIRASSPIVEYLAKELSIGYDFAERFLQRALPKFIEKIDDKKEQEDLIKVASEELYFNNPMYFNEKIIDNITEKTVFYIVADKPTKKGIKKKIYKLTVKDDSEIKLPEKVNGIFKKEYKKVLAALESDFLEIDYPIKIVLLPPKKDEIKYYLDGLSKRFKVYVTPIEEVNPIL